MQKFKITSDEVISDYNIAVVLHPLPTEIAKIRMENTAVAKRYKAVIPPNNTSLAVKIFNFLRENQNLTTEKAGMQGYSTGVDRPNLKKICKDYGLEFFQIKPFVSYYEEKMLEAQNKRFESQKEK